MTERNFEPNNETNVPTEARFVAQQGISAPGTRRAYTAPQIKDLGSWTTLTLVLSVPITVGSVFHSYGSGRKE
ncbi:hypothetical protein [Deinococcus sp. UYEF24]